MRDYLAGIRAGASPEAYAAVFTDITARRKDLEGKRTALSGSPGRPKAGKTDDSAVMAGMLRSALAVLSDPAVPGSEKRTALSPIVERVICQKGGADIVFAPGLFGDSWAKTTASGSKMALFGALVKTAPSAAERVRVKLIRPPAWA